MTTTTASRPGRFIFQQQQRAIPKFARMPRDSPELHLSTARRYRLPLFLLSSISILVPYISSPLSLELFLNPSTRNERNFQRIQKPPARASLLPWCTCARVCICTLGVEEEECSAREGTVYVFFFLFYSLARAFFADFAGYRVLFIRSRVQEILS